MRPSRKNPTGVRNLLEAKFQDAGQLNGADMSDEYCLAAKVPARHNPLMLSVWQWLFFLMLVFGVQSASAQTTWSMGYYYPQSISGLPSLSTIQWSALTHVGMIAASPNSDGSLTFVGNFASLATALISAAHANNVKVLFSLSSVGPATHFNDAVTNDESTFITNIMSQVNTYGFDGVDVDYEEGWNPTVITTLLSDLRTNLGSKLLTATANDSQFNWGNGPIPVCGSTGAGWTSTQAGYLDRLSLMSYDMGNPGNGDPYTWHNSPLYSVSGQYLWSADYLVKAAKNCGVSASKLNIGIPFYGDLYTSNTGPYQMTGGSATFMQAGYSTIATSYSIGGATYDSTAHVPWIAVGGSSYLSWENPQSINDKVNYVKTNALGGWIIWVLGWDYSPGNSPQDPLLNAVSEAFRPKPPTGIQIKVN